MLLIDLVIIKIMKLIKFLFFVLVLPLSYAETTWKDVVWLKGDHKSNIYYGSGYLLNNSGVFHVYIMNDIPRSDIIGAAESMVTEVQGDCASKEFSLVGSLFFSGEKATGAPVGSMDGDFYVRRMSRQSKFYNIFKSICGKKFPL